MFSAMTIVLSDYILILAEMFWFCNIVLFWFFRKVRIESRKIKPM